MISFSDFGMHYGAKILFEDVNGQIFPGDRYAVVGANGTGKSTFLRLMMGEETPSLGEIQIPKNATVGWVKQDHFRYDDEPVLNVVIQGKKKLWEALQKKEALLDGEWTDEAATQLSHCEETIAHEDGYLAESVAHTLLEGLGIPLTKHEEPMRTLSGGYKMRVLLAQALFESPEILLLDEPTNHLDIMTIQWLETYLIEEYKGLLIFVSHDIKFLNNVATKILDIDYGEIREYAGNYTFFQHKKKEVAEQKLKETKSIEDKIKRMQSFVDKFKAKASKARQAQSRVKMIEKLEIPDLKKSSRISPAFAFSQKRPSGKQVLKANDISKSFGEKQVLNGVGLKINRGEKVAIIGHNGIGKSTLLKICMDKLAQDEGEVDWGYEAQVAYLAQDTHEMLKEDQSALDWLTDERSEASSGAVRNMLGQMLFSNDEVHKSIMHLSGGECTRLLFANIMLIRPNVLVLDEPTNHLDIESIEALANALKRYEGTLILVSHDRHFVQKIATRIVAITEAGIKDFTGSYDQYLKFYHADYLNRAFLKAAN